MKFIIFSIFLSIALISCSNNNSAENEEGAGIENSQDSEKLKAIASLDQIVVEIQNNREDKNGNRDRLNRAFTIAETNQLFPQALGILQTLVLEYPDDPETKARLLKIGRIFQTLKKSETAGILAQALQEKYPSDQKIGDFVKSTGVANLSSDTLISHLSAKMFDDSLFQINDLIARDYVDACEAYAMVHQGKPQSAEYLHKAAETARTLQTIEKAIGLYDWIILRYPDSDRATQSLFLKAFTFDNNLQNYKEAEKYYKEFLAQHPKSEFAQSAEFLLENLGKSDEQLLEALQQKSGK